MMNSVEKNVLCELSDLVETLTTSGSPSLDQELFKRVKSICKSSDENVHHLYRLVMIQLEKRHAEIRLSSLQIIQEIFSRSHAFRELVTDHFQKLLELTVGINSDVPLPEPTSVAVTLKTEALKAIEKWHEKYGLYYKKLALGYNYVKRVKKFEFDGVRSQSALERQRAQDAETRRRHLAEQKLNIVLTQMGESVSEIKSLVTEMSNCFELVLPRPEEFDIYEETMHQERIKLDYEQPCTSSKHSGQDIKYPLCTTPVSSEDGNGSVLSHHGLASRSYQLNINLNKSVKITETPDNTIILNTLKEQQKQVTEKYLPLVQKWLDVLTKHSGHNENLVQAIDLKNSLTDLKQKFKSLKIIPAEKSVKVVSGWQNNNTEENEESENEEFFDVPEKGEVEHISESSRHEYGLEPLKESTSNSPVTANIKDEVVSKKFSANDTILWDPNGTSDDPAELGDPCSRAAAVAAFVQKHKTKKVAVKQETATESSSNIHTNDKKEPGNVFAGSAKSEKRAELLKRAPVVPFGMDLYHWGKDKDEAPSVSSLKSLHCFWTHADDENEDHCPGDYKESLKSRSIRFTGKFQEVKWACRAPLPSGKLCPRKDRYKCPFHGKIVSRDEMGQPSGECAGETPNTSTSTKEMENIIKDIELATGRDLGSKKRNKGKKRKYPGLTDLRKDTNTSRSRLEKIVFDKSSLERVSDEMTRIKQKLIDEKFGNNFNYALSK